MSKPLNAYQRRLLFRAQRRGFREMDVIMSAFAQTHLADFDDLHLKEFENILSWPDWDVYGWIVGTATPPADKQGSVLSKLIAFDYAGYIQKPLGK